jgi:hypothetical protein
MSWIKRNLYFVIGSVVALVLMGLAGWFLYSKWVLNNDILAKLNADYAELKSLNSQKPHPGAGQVNNIKIAQEQREQVREFIKKTRVYFQPIAHIPDLPKLTDQDFSVALSRTIEELQHTATNTSVTIPANYSFSFEAQKSRINFAPNSLDRLAVQLGEVKQICQGLFQAKINSLDNLRRERVSPDDSAGPQTDYLTEKSVTNELAVMTPYEVTFRCFSSELASVLSNFAASQAAILVKTINVEVAPAPPPVEPTANPVAMNPAYQYVTPTPQVSADVEDAMARANAQAAMARRYGNIMGRGGGAAADSAALGGIAYHELSSTPAQPQQPYAVLPTPTGPAGAAKGGLPTVLDEKQLKLTVNLLLVKLLPPPK